MRLSDSTAAELNTWIEEVTSKLGTRVERVVDGRAVALHAVEPKGRRYAGDPRFDSFHLGTASDDGGWFKLSVAHGHVYPLARALGWQDVVIGNVDWDGRHIVKSNDEDFARRWLLPLVTSDKLTRPFRIEAGRVELEWPIPTLSRAATIRELLPVVRDLLRFAGGGTEILAGVRNIATALGVVPHGDRFALDGSVGFSVERGSVRVAIDLWRGEATRDGAHVYTRLRVQCADDLRGFALVARPDQPRKSRLTPQHLTELAIAPEYRMAGDPSTLLALLSPARQAAIRSARPHVIAKDGLSVVVLARGILDLARLEPLIALAADLVRTGRGAQAGPYR